MESSHTKFLLSSLWQSHHSFPDTRVRCRDGSVRHNRLFLGLAMALLRDLPEFCLPDTEPLVLLPDISLEEYFQGLRQILGGGEDEEVVLQDEQDMEHLEIVLEEGGCLVGRSEESVQLPGAVDRDVLPCGGHQIRNSEHYDIGDLGSCPNKQELVNGIQLNSGCEWDNGNNIDEFIKRSDLENSSEQESNRNFQGSNSCEQFSCQDRKPHVCIVCGRRFVSRSNLRAHGRLHEGTALRYPCDICGKKFSHPSEVKQHQVVHTGQFNIIGINIF